MTKTEGFVQVQAQFETVARDIETEAARIRAEFQEFYDRFGSLLRDA